MERLKVGTAIWKAQNGVLVGEVTPETLLKRNTFINWRDGELADFELEIDYRIFDQGNSGINYRSTEFPDAKRGMQGTRPISTVKMNIPARITREKGGGFLA